MAKKLILSTTITAYIYDEDVTPEDIYLCISCANNPNHGYRLELGEWDIADEQSD